MACVADPLTGGFSTYFTSFHSYFIIIYSYLTLINSYFTVSTEVLKISCSACEKPELATIRSWSFLNPSASLFLKTMYHSHFRNRFSCGTRALLFILIIFGIYIPPLIPKLPRTTNRYVRSALHNSSSKGHFGFSHQNKPEFF